MNDSHKFRDHRYEDARATRDKCADVRGYDFRMESIVDQSPLWIRAIEILCRPSSVFSLGLLGLCVWLLVKF